MVETVDLSADPLRLSSDAALAIAEKSRLQVLADCREQGRARPIAFAQGRELPGLPFEAGALERESHLIEQALQQRKLLWTDRQASVVTRQACGGDDRFFRPDWVDLPLDGTHARQPATGRFAGRKDCRDRGDVGRRQLRAIRLRRDETRLGQSGQHYSITIEQCGEFLCSRFGDLLFARASQQPSGKAGYRRIAIGMLLRQAGLRADRSGEMGSHDRHAEQDHDRYDVARAVDPERVVGRREEVIVRESGGDCRQQRRAKSREDCRAQNGRQIDEVNRCGAPARSDQHPDKRRGTDKQRRRRISAQAGSWGSGVGACQQSYHGR